jgi:hypothetical protein
LLRTNKGRYCKYPENTRRRGDKAPFEGADIVGTKILKQPSKDSALAFVEDRVMAKKSVGLTFEGSLNVTITEEPNDCK